MINWITNLFAKDGYVLWGHEALIEVNDRLHQWTWEPEKAIKISKDQYRIIAADSAYNLEFIASYNILRKRMLNRDF